jgi:hypothetical protein
MLHTYKNTLQQAARGASEEDRLCELAEMEFDSAKQGAKSASAPKSSKQGNKQLPRATFLPRHGLNAKARLVSCILRQPDDKHAGWRESQNLSGMRRRCLNLVSRSVCLARRRQCGRSCVACAGFARRAGWGLRPESFVYCFLRVSGSPHGTMWTAPGPKRLPDAHPGSLS